MILELAKPFWEHVVEALAIIEHPVEVIVPRRPVVDLCIPTDNEMLGYEASFWPQGLWRVSCGRPTARVVRRFDVKNARPLSENSGIDYMSDTVEYWL